MLRIGLTGGIASGKSEVADAFATLGVPVIDTDVLALEVTAAGSDGLAEIVTAFGAGFLDNKGELDRRRMRAHAFADAAARKRLEGIVHPRVRSLLDKRMAALDAAYVIIVVPLLVEANMTQEMHRVLVVDCPEAVQIERLTTRDGIGEADARAMLAAQADRATRAAAADDVIVNDSDLHHLRSEVAKLHQRYLALARHRSGT